MSDRKPDYYHEYERAFWEFMQLATRALTIEEEVRLSQLITKLRKLGSRLAKDELENGLI